MLAPHSRHTPCAVALAFTALIFVASGCGGPAALPVGGVVTMKGQPLANALVTFHPIGETPGLGGFATTGADGGYIINGNRGEKGLSAGEYKVTVSLRLRPDGSLPDPMVPPMESDAREMLRPEYHERDATKLSATVDKNTTSYDFKVEK